MSVLVKGMKMPKDCPMCPCAHWNKLDILTGCELVWRYVPDSETAYWQSDKRPDWCPLVEVPTPHGRLVDTDNLVSVIDDEFEEVTRTFQNPIELFRKSLLCGFAKDVITAAPTIIEAEEGE